MSMAVPDVSLLSIAFAIGGAAGGLAVALLKVWFEKRVNSSSERALAEFKHRLDSTTAAASFDYQRRLQEYNLFIAKKHQTLAELHELLLDAYSQISRWAQGGTDRVLLARHNYQDASDYLEKHTNVPKGKRSEIMDLWETDRDEALRLLYEFQDSMQGEYARRAWVKANNYRLGHELYLPEPISARADEFTKNLYAVWQRAELEGPGSATLRVAASNLNEPFVELRSMMRSEMMRGELPTSSSGSVTALALAPTS